MAIKGSCLCGKVTFEIDNASGPFEICHCSRCRKVTGSHGVPAIGVATADYRMLTGADQVRYFSAPILNSPPAYTATFCATCGSPVPEPDPEGDWFEICAGLFDDPLDIRPDKHIYVEFTPGWDKISDGLPQYTREELYKLRGENQD